MRQGRVIPLEVAAAEDRDRWWANTGSTERGEEEVMEEEEDTTEEGTEGIGESTGLTTRDIEVEEGETITGPIITGGGEITITITTTRDTTGEVEGTTTTTEDAAAVTTTIIGAVEVPAEAAEGATTTTSTVTLLRRIRRLRPRRGRATGRGRFRR